MKYGSDLKWIRDRDKALRDSSAKADSTRAMNSGYGIASRVLLGDTTVYRPGDASRISSGKEMKIDYDAVKKSKKKLRKPMTER